MGVEAIRNFFNPNPRERRLSGEYIVGLDNIPEDIVDTIELAARLSAKNNIKEATDLYRHAAFQSRMEFETTNEENIVQRADKAALTLSLYVSGHQAQVARNFGQSLLENKNIPTDYKISISGMLNFLEQNPEW